MRVKCYAANEDAIILVDERRREHAIPLARLRLKFKLFWGDLVELFFDASHPEMAAWGRLTTRAWYRAEVLKCFPERHPPFGLVRIDGLPGIRSEINMERDGMFFFLPEGEQKIKAGDLVRFNVGFGAGRTKAINVSLV